MPSITLNLVVIRASDIDTALTALVSAGGVVIAKPRDSEWGRRAVVSDPDGQRVELTQRNMPK